jgi:serine/threonine-protein kinase
MNDELPASIGEYQVTGLLGEGAVAQVYAGVHPLTGKAVAIKVMREGHNPEYRTVERFIAEVRTVTALCHPNIINIYTFGTLPDGRPYFVMEYRPGMTLQQRLDRDGPLTFLEAAPIFIQACQALEAAHAHGVIHRDLKPDNIYLADDTGGPPMVKLLDFGIAKLATQHPSAGLTQVGSTVGTPLYMSPEQIRAGSLDARSDIYTLGVSLFQALTGEVPFYADSHAQTASMHLSQAPPRPSEVCDLLPIPERAEAIVMRCLEKLPESRFASMNELRRELEEAAAELLSARQLTGSRPPVRLALPSVPPLPPGPRPQPAQQALQDPPGSPARAGQALHQAPGGPESMPLPPSLITPVNREPEEPARPAPAVQVPVRATAEVPAMRREDKASPRQAGPSFWRNWETWAWLLALLLGLALVWLSRDQLTRWGR